MAKEDKNLELAKKYNINLEDLKAEQRKLAKSLTLKDSQDFSEINTIAGSDITTIANRIIASITVCDPDLEILEQKYSIQKANFPYIPSFRSYRELPALVDCFSKLEQKPDILLIPGHGIAHPNNLGLASHFSLTVNTPTIGIAKTLLAGEIKKGKIIINNKTRGQELKTKKGSNPIYISPGNQISLKTAVKIAKQTIRPPHKFPEPIAFSHRYSMEVKRELQRKAK